MAFTEPILSTLQASTISSQLSAAEGLVFALNVMYELRTVLARYPQCSTSQVKALDDALQTTLVRLVQALTAGILAKAGGIGEKISLILKVSSEAERNKQKMQPLSTVPGLEKKSMASCLQGFYHQLFSVGEFLMPLLASPIAFLSSCVAYLSSSIVSLSSSIATLSSSISSVLFCCHFAPCTAFLSSSLATLLFLFLLVLIFCHFACVAYLSSSIVSLSSSIATLSSSISSVLFCCHFAPCTAFLSSSLATLLFLFLLVLIFCHFALAPPFCPLLLPLYSFVLPYCPPLLPFRSSYSSCPHTLPFCSFCIPFLSSSIATLLLLLSTCPPLLPLCSFYCLYVLYCHFAPSTVFLSSSIATLLLRTAFISSSIATLLLRTAFMSSSIATLLCTDRIQHSKLRQQCRHAVSKQVSEAYRLVYRVVCDPEQGYGNLLSSSPSSPVSSSLHTPQQIDALLNVHAEPLSVNKMAAADQGPGQTQPSGSVGVKHNVAGRSQRSNSKKVAKS
eukprot:g8215.t1